jgi:hypothetical protein
MEPALSDQAKRESRMGGPLTKRLHGAGKLTRSVPQCALGDLFDFCMRFTASELSFSGIFHFFRRANQSAGRIVRLLRPTR